MANVRGDIGRRVRVARKLAGLRVVELAHELGLVPATIYRWEWGRNDPSEEDCRVIATLCRVKYPWLMTGVGKPRRDMAVA